MHRSTAITLATVSLLALGACSKPAPSQQANSSPPSPPPVATVPPPPPPAPPDPNEQLFKALDTIGAEQSDRGRVVRLSSAQFEPGQTKFQPSDTQRIDNIVSLLRDHPETHVMIEGYTDSRGSETANKKIATERAEGARKLLVDRGIEPSRIEVKGVGEENPVADNGTADGRQENRRVELIFSDAQGRFASASAPAATG